MPTAPATTFIFEVVRSRGADGAREACLRVVPREGIFAVRGAAGAAVPPPTVTISLHAGHWNWSPGS